LLEIIHKLEFECPCRIPHKAAKDCLTENFCNGVYEKIKVKCIEYEKGGTLCESLT